MVQVMLKRSRTAFTGISQPGLTQPIQVLKGKPRSRLKAQTCRDALAIVVTVEKKRRTISKLPRTQVAAYDPVALKTM